MKKIVITGATDGIGRSLALHYLKQGEQVIAVANSQAKAVRLQEDARAFPGQLSFIQADLSSVHANKTLIAKLHKDLTHIDMLVLCAHVFKQERQETTEGLEVTLALSYISRFLLSFGLADLLDASSKPIIVNVAGSGMGGRIRWDDLQSKQQYRPFAVALQNSHLNDILGVDFSARFPGIHYLLFNPVFVRTPGLLNGYANPLVRRVVSVLAHLFARSSDQTALTIAHISTAINQPLSLYKQSKQAKVPDEPKENIERLEVETHKLLETLNKNPRR